MKRTKNSVNSRDVFFSNKTVSKRPGGSGIFMQRNGDGSLRVYLYLRVKEDWATSNPTFDWDDHQKMTVFLINTFFSDWDPRLRDIIRNVDQNMTPRAQYRMPLGLRYDHRQGLTLIGDSLHVMSWFAGEGANLAMLDALDLFHEIHAHPEDLDLAVRIKVVTSGRADVTNEMSQDLLVKQCRMTLLGRTLKGWPGQWIAGLQTGSC